MYLKNLKEVGAPNILKWAMANGVNLKNDPALQLLINEEMAYLLDIGNVNFLELFRLTQFYRDKVRIMLEHPAAAPEKKELQEMFPGEYQEKDGDKPMNLADAAEAAIASFMNLSLQMNADADIIQPGAARLFFPMITRKFDVQIPISFMQIINSLSEEEAEKIFGQEYPESLTDFMMEGSNNLSNMLMLSYAKITNIARYTPDYDRYLKNLIYAPLSTYTGNSLFKFVLNAFSKYDSVLRNDIRCSMFHQNPETMKELMKIMSRKNAPLECDFTIQLPIQYMRNLLGSYSMKDLPVRYESSMGNIIDNDLMYHDFVMPEGDPEDDNVKNTLNQIEAYKVRIGEANHITMNAIPIIMNSAADIDVTGAFALFPSMYSAKAVISVRDDMLPTFVKDTDPVISKMFSEIQDVMRDLNNSIEKLK